MFHLGNNLATTTLRKQVKAPTIPLSTRSQRTQQQCRGWPFHRNSNITWVIQGNPCYHDKASQSLEPGTTLQCAKLWASPPGQPTFSAHKTKILRSTLQIYGSHSAQPAELMQHLTASLSGDCCLQKSSVIMEFPYLTSQLGRLMDNSICKTCNGRIEWESFTKI